MLTISRNLKTPSWHTAWSVLLYLQLVGSALAAGNDGLLTGRILDPQGSPVAGAQVKLLNSAGAFIQGTTSDEQGAFALNDLDAGEYQLIVRHPSFVSVTSKTSLSRNEHKDIKLQFRQLASVLESIRVVSSAPSSLAPDPSQSVVIHDQVLDANPGRPGAPISIPGLPIETASGGIKAPQYFAPGVAGDHGEPIAQYFRVGDFLYPNNLPANAHGNGYADPNFLIPPVIDAVTIDGGAFDVREGNHAVDLAATYVSKERLNSFVQLTGDYHDADAMAGWGPKNPTTDGWLAMEAALGNGFLDRLEHRQQYKLNGRRKLAFGQHELTLFGMGYYGFSDVPGLVPVDVSVPADTIDLRQLERTHSFILVASDQWKPGEQKQVSFSGFLRNYALALQSDFGDGLIRQSESRNVAGGEVTYLQQIRPWISLLAGVDLRRDAPRNLDLQHIDDQGSFQLVTSNNLTLSFVEPFVSLDGTAGKYFHYDLGLRQEAVRIDNQDVLNPANSFDKLAMLILPKGTFTFLPAPRTHLPTVAFSYGEAFHTEDPRIGTGTAKPTLLASSRAYQVVFSKAIKQVQFYLELRRVSNSQELAKIDPDTGLQEIVGPSLNKVLSLSLQRNFTHGAFFASYAQAAARDTQTGEPVPEAPRAIWDVVASENHLPFRLQVRGEFEYVEAKPLGDGFIGVPVREIRGAVLRPFDENRMTVGANFLLANGYTGQTTETLALPGDPAPFERVVGVPLKSYASLSWTYYLKK